MHIVLVEPEIPPNTGNIARLCAATNTTLHLVGKLGFSTEDRYLKRSGLDYWPLVDLHFHDSLEVLEKIFPNNNFYYFSTKAKKIYTDVSYQKNDFLVFGKETKGLPEDLIFSNYDKAVKIPMKGKVRSINLSTSAGIALFEALRQTGYMKEFQ